MSTSIPIVSAHLGLFGCIVCRGILGVIRKFLFVECKDNNFNVLLRSCIADKLDTELFIWPVLTDKRVKDGTCIAIVFLETLGKHAL